MYSINIIIVRIFFILQISKSVCISNYFPKMVTYSYQRQYSIKDRTNHTKTNFILGLDKAFSFRSDFADLYITRFSHTYAHIIHAWIDTPTITAIPQLV